MRNTNQMLPAQIRILSREAQKTTFGGYFAAQASCSAKCWGKNGGTVSCQGNGECTATDAKDATPSGVGKCCIGSDCMYCDVPKQD